MEKNHSKNIHVVLRNGQWVVRGETTKRVRSIHTTQYDAINAARLIAKNEKSDLVIHGIDGRIRERDSYYSGPLPPKSPRKILFPILINKVDEKKIKKAINEVISERKDM
ncbi:MAG: hypothetical protein C0410_07700 [Anaerolinea sp.]|nr:hypothetical protein [Anaerolinea sp.]